MLQARDDKLRRIFIIGEEPVEEKIEYCDFGIIYTNESNKKSEKKVNSDAALREFEKMLKW